MSKTASFPSVRVTPELRERVQNACNSLGVQYSTVVSNLLEQWVTGRAHLDMELDADFVASAREALESLEVQGAFKQIGHGYKRREYQESKAI